MTEKQAMWRACGPYLPTSVLHPALVGETRQFLLTYAHLGDISATTQALVDNGLPQRSRYSRTTVVKAIRSRLERWCPPPWVWDDLVSFAQDELGPSLQVALLLHVVRQDSLLYDFIQQVVVPRWSDGERVLIRSDVQRFLDQAQAAHPEIDGWTYITREKIASNTLTILRDYGLLRGSSQKMIIEPVVPVAVARHLVRLLRAEGAVEDALAAHSDWRIWLWDARGA